MSKIKIQGLRSEYLTKDLVAMSPDTVVVVDSVDSKVIHILDAGSGKEMNKVTHTAEVLWYVRTLFCFVTSQGLFHEIQISDPLYGIFFMNFFFLVFFSSYRLPCLCVHVYKYVFKYVYMYI